MKVGFTCRQTVMEGRGNMTEWEGEYVKYYSQFGIHPILLTPEMLEGETIEPFVKELELEGFIIGGGNGVDPKLWDEERLYENRWSEPRQKLNEWVLQYAEQNSLPVLGVCTGLHVMNVYFGGRLLQNIGKQMSSSIIHSSGDGKPHTPHEVQLIGITAYGSTVMVNSYHNQGILPEMVGKELVIWATCKDGTVEALYHKKFPFVGVTWHPERDYASPNKEFNGKLIRDFVNRQGFWKK